MANSKQHIHVWMTQQHAHALYSVLVNLDMLEMQKGAAESIKNVICIHWSIMCTCYADHVMHGLHTSALGCVMYYATKIWANFSTVTTSRVLCLYLKQEHQNGIISIATYSLRLPPKKRFLSVKYGAKIQLQTCICRWRRAQAKQFRTLQMFDLLGGDRKKIRPAPQKMSKHLSNSFNF